MLNMEKITSAVIVAVAALLSFSVVAAAFTALGPTIA